MSWKKTNEYFENGNFEEKLVNKLVEASKSWDRERQDNEVPAKMLGFCWKRYQSQPPEELLKNPRVILGTLVHRGLEHYFGQPDKPENVIKKPIGEYVIVGMPDLVMDDTVYEFKYSTSPPNKPKPWDEQQLRVYLWMTGLERGELVYITPMRIKSFVITKPAADEELMSWLNYKWAKYKWECNTCPFRHECPHRLV